MRRIGILNDEADARRFSDFLVSQSIDATMDHDESEGVWNIWVRDEQQIEKARQQFAEFQQNPQAAQYQEAERAAAKIRDEQVAAELQRRKREREIARSTPANRTMLDRIGAEKDSGAKLKQNKIPVTIAIIVISVLATLASNFGRPVTRSDGKLGISTKTFLLFSFVDRRDDLNGEDPFASIKKGQWWRLVTPMFLHGDEMHLAFNMLMLFFLGSSIERLQGSLFLVLLTFGTQTTGMLLQVALPSEEFLPEVLHGLAGSPFAIGASGAVYGLFGYLWVRPAVDPAYPIHLVPIFSVLMLGWLIACMTPLVPDVANGAHLGGMMGGIFIALIGRAVTR